VLAAAAVVGIPQVPLGLLTTAVQALAGVLLPSATVFLLLLSPSRSAWRTLGLVVLRCYLLTAIAVLAARAIQIALGSG
jgi:Mn2+/Fe2+ NRAMP family transporter